MGGSDDLSAAGSLDNDRRVLERSIRTSDIDRSDEQFLAGDNCVSVPTGIYRSVDDDHIVRSGGGPRTRVTVDDSSANAEC